MLRAPAPAVGRLVLVELRERGRPDPSARHGHSPRPARCALQAAAAGPRNRGAITPPNDRPAPGAGAAPAGTSPGRASQPIGAAPGPRQPISGCRAAANRCPPGAGPQLATAGRVRASPLRPPRPPGPDRTTARPGQLWPHLRPPWLPSPSLCNGPAGPGSRHLGFFGKSSVVPTMPRRGPAAKRLVGTLQSALDPRETP